MDSITNSFTNLDAKDVKQSLIDYLVNTHNVRESDITESSVLAIIIELLAGTSDMLNYRIDRQALETYLNTAKQRSNIKAILNNLGYRMKMGSTGIGECKAVIPLNQFASGRGVTINKGTQLIVEDEEGSRFNVSCTRDTLIPYPNPTQTKTLVPIALGTYATVNVTVENIIESNRIYITSSPDKFVDASHVTLVIANRVWKQVENVLTDYSDSGETYCVFEDKYDRPYILLHRNYKRTLQAYQNQPVVISYLESPIQYQPKGNLTVRPTSALSVENQVDMSPITFSEMSDLIGHSDRETILSAKKSAMMNLKTLDRAVTLSDFEAMGLRVPGVKNCKAVDWKSKMIQMPYEVALLVHVEGGLVLSNEFIKKVKAEIEPKMLSTIVLDVRTANVIKVDIEADIIIDSVIYDESLIVSEVISHVRNYFKDFSETFGNHISTSEIIYAIRSYNRMIKDVQLKVPSVGYDEVTNIYSIYELGDVEISIRRGE